MGLFLLLKGGAVNTYAFDLNLDKKYRGKYIVIRQGDDDSTTVTATLYDQGVPFTDTGFSAKFKMTLPDGQHYYRADATYNAGVVSIVLDEEYAASYPGRTDDAYFELTKGTAIYSTEPISVVIRRDATDGMTEGKDYDDEIVATIEGWLDVHPEATTTVTDDSLTTLKYKDGSVTEPKLATEAVSTRVLGGSSVTTAKIDNLAVTEAKLASDAVTTPKILDEAVTFEKLDPDIFAVVTDAEIVAMFD